MSDSEEFLEEALNAMEEERDDLQKQLTVYSEMLAQVLNETGPVKVKKGNRIPAGAGIDVDFDPKGEYATISLVVPDEQ